jgi:hypothetical protein
VSAVGPVLDRRTLADVTDSGSSLAEPIDADLRTLTDRSIAVPRAGIRAHRSI